MFTTKWFSDFTIIPSPVFWERIKVRAIKQIRKPLRFEYNIKLAYLGMLRLYKYLHSGERFDGPLNLFNPKMISSTAATTTANR
jgi:hypothetical protein